MADYTNNLRPLYLKSDQGHYLLFLVGDSEVEFNEQIQPPSQSYSVYFRNWEGAAPDAGVIAWRNPGQPPETFFTDTFCDGRFVFRYELPTTTSPYFHLALHDTETNWDALSVDTTGDMVPYFLSWCTPFLVASPDGVHYAAIRVASQWGQAFMRTNIPGVDAPSPIYLETFEQRYGYGITKPIVGVSSAYYIGYSGQYNYRDVISWTALINGAASEPQPQSDDPYNPGGVGGWPYSGTDPIGGGGDFNNISDPIPEPTVPTISAVDCGFVTLYNPTLGQLNSLSAYMWSPLFTVDTLKKIFADPMDIILGLMIVPVDVPAGITQEVTVGGFSTGVQMTVAGAQYIEKDCGSITLTPFFGSYLDYAPYTKVQLYLPFIGTVEMNPDELMGRTVNVKYIVDIATGACTAFVRVSGGDGRASKSNLSGPLYTFAGQCCQPVPVTGSNWNQLISSVVQVATTAIAAGSGAIGAAAAAASATQVGGDFTPEFAGQQTGDTSMPRMHEAGSYRPVPQMRSASPDQVPEEYLAPIPQSTPMGLGESSELPVSTITPLGLTGAAGTAAGLVNSVMNSKVSIGHSGSLSSVSGMIGIKTPFFIITRPSLSLAESYRELHGYPANATHEFSGLSGFTKVEATRLTSMTCLTPELNEIYGWLKEGVVF